MYHFVRPLYVTYNFTVNGHNHRRNGKKQQTTKTVWNEAIDRKGNRQTIKQKEINGSVIHVYKSKKIQATLGKTFVFYKIQ